MAITGHQGCLIHVEVGNRQSYASRRMLLRLLQFDTLSSLTKWTNKKVGLRHYNVACLGNKREINCKRPSNKKNKVQICIQSPCYVQQAIQSHEYDKKSVLHAQASAGSG